MARIRSIKPEFWTDATMVALPFEARLFFIGLWNFADDSGRFEDEPARLRLQILPDDSVDAEGLLALLEAAGRIELCLDEEGARFWRICHFQDHQKIDHPTKSKFSDPLRKRAIPLSVRRELARKYGCPPGGSASVECFYCAAPGEIRWWSLKNGRPSAWVSFTLEIDHAEAEASGGPSTSDNLVLACRHCNRQKGFVDVSEFLAKVREDSRDLTAGGERKGKDGKGKEMERKGGEPAAPDLSAESADAIAAGFKILLGRPKLLQELWNDRAHRSLPRWLETSKARKAAADARIREHPTFEHWAQVIERINASRFCLGENDRGWRASPDWLLKPDTGAKVLEGKYDRGRGLPTNGRASEADKDWSDMEPLPEATAIFQEAL